MCKQFLKRQIVTDVAGLIIFRNKQVLYTVSTEVRIFINDITAWLPQASCLGLHSSPLSA